MDISSVSTQSVGFYDSLTSPFLQKRVSINAYTPITPAEPTEEIFSKDFFANKKKVYSNLYIQNNKVDLMDPKNMVEYSINSGYSPMEAVQIYKAHKAYGLSSLGPKQGVYGISSSIYEI